MNDSIPVRLKNFRIALSLTRKEFANLIGVSPRSIEAVENNGSVPGGEILSKVAHLYPHVILWILTGDSGVNQLSPDEYIEQLELENALEKVKQQGFTVTKN